MLTEKYFGSTPKIGHDQNCGECNTVKAILNRYFVCTSHEKIPLFICAECESKVSKLDER